MKKRFQIFAQFNQLFLIIIRKLDGIVALSLRLYLVPVFWMAGMMKLNNFQDTVNWFGNTEWGLSLPLPTIMAFLATSTEIIGSIFLFFGFMTRIICIPLCITMLVAIFTVHLENGWQAIADPKAPFANEQVFASSEKLEKANEILMQYGNYDWLSSSGSFVILNNGTEFAVTYLIMLLCLIFIGGGRYVSVDDWFRRNYFKD